MPCFSNPCMLPADPTRYAFPWPAKIQLSVCVLVLLFVAIPFRVPAAEETARPNIVLVVTDDQGYWDTGISGNEKIDTPTMDRLAREGVNFTHFYANMVCAPTRAGLMTGRYYLRTGLYNTRFGGDTMGRDEITVAQLLRGAGYRTGLFGKWHLGKYAGYQPHQRGFDQFFGHYHGHIERYDYPDQLVHNGRPVEARGYITDLLTDAAIEFIRARRSQPFLCYLAFNAPHSPFVAGASHDGQPRGDALIEKYLSRGLPLRDARIYAMVEIIDDNLKRLLGAIDDEGIRENTIVMFTSDNGGVSRAFKAGLKGGKASPWEGGVRVPFFVRWPGHFAEGAQVDGLATQMDLLPTLCELLDVELPANRKFDGRSILPLMKNGKGASPHRYVYHTWDRYTPNPHNRWSIGEARYKLVGMNTKGKPEPAGQLFDLQSDPGEKNDIAADHPEIAARLRNEFLRWFAEVTDGQEYRPAAIPVGRPEEPVVELQPSWAEWKGEAINYTFRGYDWDTIDSWSQSGEFAIWRLDVAAAGKYEIAVAYGCRLADAGGKLRIAVGDSAIELTPHGTPSPDVFIRQRLGTIELSQGPAVLKAEAIEVPGDELMRLNRIWLRRVAERR